MTTRPKPIDHGTIFQPDVVLPLQFLNRRRSQTTGEEHLMLAILDDAINCFQKFLFAKTSAHRRLFREAEEWMMGEEQNGPFSFVNICDVLGFDPDYLRQGLQQWRQRQLDAAWRPASEMNRTAHHPHTVPLHVRGFKRVLS